MPEANIATVAIVDFGAGNLFSVARACEWAGLAPTTSSSAKDLETADAIILPGIGSFGEAMQSLHRLDLVAPLRDAAQQNKPMFGICLGLQLLFRESHEFGRHAGLGIIEGEVRRIQEPGLRVPQVGWRRVEKRTHTQGFDSWSDSPLDGLSDREFMYFVHSYHVVPEDQGDVLSLTRYGELEFCSSIQRGTIFACQFHPERSGSRGLQVYDAFASKVRSHVASC